MPWLCGNIQPLGLRAAGEDEGKQGWDSTFCVSQLMLQLVHV